MIQEAELMNDLERAAAARVELEFLTTELGRSFGLGGRARKIDSQAERARLSVTRAIKSVREKLATENEALSAHLQATVKTGYFCSYTPDPRLDISWRIRF